MFGKEMARTTEPLKGHGDGKKRERQQPIRLVFH